MLISEKMMPFWSAQGADLYLGDVRECLRRMSTRSVHCVVTSPPYWGLRDYGTGVWEGGSEECDHVEGFTRGVTASEGKSGSTLHGVGVPAVSCYKDKCKKCGGIRVDWQIGNETTPEQYITILVNVFSEVRRVMRDDATLWLNLGDTFDNGQQLIPSRVALALVADGWKLVQDIIWYSPNKMPESVTNRCAKSHEHIFILTKGDDYYFDHVAIQETAKSKYKSSDFIPKSNKDAAATAATAATAASVNGRDDIVRQYNVNKRDVWIVPTKGYSGAHFAAFSPELITPCILAGTSEHGCCAECKTPYERVVSKTGGVIGNGDIESRDRSFPSQRNGLSGSNSTLDGTIPTRKTVGWRKVCGCKTSEVEPCTVLDPFVGSGTTVAASLHLGRYGAGIDLSKKYLQENAVPRIEAAMRGEKVERKTVVMPIDVTPVPTRLR